MNMRKSIMNIINTTIHTKHPENNNHINLNAAMTTPGNNINITPIINIPRTPEGPIVINANILRTIIIPKNINLIFSHPFNR